MWHDHGKIAGQDHFLVSGICDPAFYVTPDELQNRGQDDVINIVEQPELHIIARSGSADIDQLSYNECQAECALELGKSLEGKLLLMWYVFSKVTTQAQQFEAGNNRAGNYPCVSCSTPKTRFDYLSYSFRQPVIALEDRQQFMLQGRVWQTGGTRPFDDLSKADIKGELEAHACNKSITRPPTAVHLEEMNTKELQELAQVRKRVLHLHNLTFQYATLCIQMFPSPKSVKTENVWKLFSVLLEITQE